MENFVDLSFSALIDKFEDNLKKTSKSDETVKAYTLDVITFTKLLMPDFTTKLG